MIDRTSNSVPSDDDHIDTTEETHSSQAQKTWKRHHALLPSKSALVPVLGVLILVSGIGAFLAMKNSSFDSRQRAATSTGVVSVSVKPGSSTFTPGTPQTLLLQTNTASANIVGYELFINFNGTVPSNLKYAPAPIPGLTTAISTMTPTSTGQQLTLGLLTPVSSPPQPFTTSGGTVTLGQLTFTTPTAGSLSVSFDQQRSRALLFDPNSTSETDVLKTLPTYTYAFAAAATAAPTTNPTISPTSLPTTPPTTQDTTRPVVNITFPVNEATVSRSALVTIQATASDNVRVSQVEFLVNGALVTGCMDMVAPYTCSWKVPGKRNSNFTITAKATDAAGNVGTSTIRVKTPLFR